MTPVERIVKYSLVWVKTFVHAFAHVDQSVSGSLLAGRPQPPTATIVDHEVHCVIDGKPQGDPGNGRLISDDAPQVSLFRVLPGPQFGQRTQHKTDQQTQQLLTVVVQQPRQKTGEEQQANTTTQGHRGQSTPGIIHW